MSVAHASSHHDRESFQKSPQQIGRDAVSQAETIGTLTQRHDAELQAYRGLQKEWLDAKNAGIPVGNLPAIHDRMSKPDMETAMASINKLRGRPTTIAAQRTQQAAGTPGAAPLTPAIMQGQPSMGGAAPLNRQPSALTPSSPPASTAPSAAPDPFAKIIKTPTGLQAPAVRADGSPMSNPDGTARYVGTLPNKVPAGVESRVLDTGVGPTNARGETKMQTTGGPVVEVDPYKDLKTSWLAKGDPLLPKGADRGVVIDPKYGGGIGYATGGDTAAARTRAPAVTTPVAPTAPAVNPAPKPGIPENPFNVADASTHPIQPSRGQMLTNPLMFPPKPDAAPQSIAMGGTPAPAATGAGALGARLHNDAVAGVNQVGASAVNAGIKATDATMSAAGATRDFTTGLVTGKAPAPVIDDEEKRRRMANAGSVPFDGFGSGNKF